MQVSVNLVKPTKCENFTRIVRGILTWGEHILRCRKISWVPYLHSTTVHVKCGNLASKRRSGVVSFTPHFTLIGATYVSPCGRKKLKIYIWVWDTVALRAIRPANRRSAKRTKLDGHTGRCMIYNNRKFGNENENFLLRHFVWENWTDRRVVKKKFDRPRAMTEWQIMTAFTALCGVVVRRK